MCGRGGGRGGGELPSVGVTGPWQSSFMHRFKEGQPILFLTQAGLHMLFSVVMVFFFLFFFLPF